jgi:hypothetical protein
VCDQAPCLLNDVPVRVDQQSGAESVDFRLRNLRDVGEYQALDLIAELLVDLRDPSPHGVELFLYLVAELLKTLVVDNSVEGGPVEGAVRSKISGACHDVHFLGHLRPVPGHVRDGSPSSD